MTVRSAIVLAAGEGMRLRPLTRHRPKPMLPAATKPILEHVFDELIEAGIEQLTVVVGYGRTAVQSHFGPAYRDVPIEYAIQNKQLGSAHALEAALPTVDEPSLVVNGDQLIDASIVRDTIDSHDVPAAGTIGVVAANDVTEYGGVIVDSDGIVAELAENPTDDRCYRLNAGVYVLEPDAIDIVTSVDSREGEYSLPDGLSLLLERGETVNAAETEGMWIDATYPWDLLTVAETLFDTETVESTVDGTAQVHESATILEPAIVSPDCVIGPGAVVGPYASLGDNVTVGSNTTVENSVLDSDTRVGTNATVLDCVTGRGVEIGPGSTVVGGRSDIRVGTAVHEGQRLGALLADRASDEGGVTYAPGTIIGSAVTIHAGRRVRGSIDSETEVR